MSKKDSNPYQGNFAVMSTALSIQSSYDPRTHQELGLGGKYDYYNFGKENEKQDPFQKNFQSFVDESNNALKEITKLNDSVSTNNYGQSKLSNNLESRDRRQSQQNGYTSLSEENQREGRFTKELNDVVPSDIYNNPQMSIRDEEVASKFLNDQQYVDINETNAKRGIQENEIEQLDDILNSLE